MEPEQPKEPDLRDRQPETLSLEDRKRLYGTEDINEARDKHARGEFNE